MTAAHTETDRGTCVHCPASAEGCQARQTFARERCCRRCTHPSDDDTASPAPRMRAEPSRARPARPERVPIPAPNPPPKESR